MLLFALKKSSGPPSPGGGGFVWHRGSKGVTCYSQVLYALSRVWAEFFFSFSDLRISEYFLITVISLP